jgi:hypothetical protein
MVPSTRRSLWLITASKNGTHQGVTLTNDGQREFFALDGNRQYENEIVELKDINATTSFPRNEKNGLQQRWSVPTIFNTYRLTKRLD